MNSSSLWARGYIAEGAEVKWEGALDELYIVMRGFGHRVERESMSRNRCVKKKGRSATRLTALNRLVAGAGFEPTTFGL